jgi:hypothetical protein
MSEFQKLAIGLLGLTHPEMVIARAKAAQKSAATIEVADDDGPFVRAMRAARFLLAALAIGSRTVPLADNSQLNRDLGARAAAIYGPSEDY